MYHDRIKARTQAIGLKNRVLSQLIGISSSRLSLFLKGCCSIKPEQQKKLTDVLEEIAFLQKAFPVPVSLDDARLLEVALSRQGKGLFEPFRKMNQATRWDNADFEGKAVTKKAANEFTEPELETK